MKDQAPKYDIVEEIRQKGPNFRSDVPSHAWSRIESSLDKVHSSKQISFYKLFYNAAMVALLAVVSFLMFSVVKKYNTPKFAQKTYTESIESLNVSVNTYPVYDIHKLYNAYLKLEVGGKSKQIRSPQ
jgi:hypothetical protein